MDLTLEELWSIDLPKGTAVATAYLVQANKHALAAHLGHGESWAHRGAADLLRAAASAELNDLPPAYEPHEPKA